MQPRMAWLFGALVLGSAGWAALSISREPGQAPHKSLDTPTVAPATSQTPSALEPRVRASLFEAAAWLARSSEADAVGVSQDHSRRQASAALALARVARFTGQASEATLAQQRIQALRGACTRKTLDGRPPAASSLLVLAMLALPTPAQQTFDQVDALCRGFAKQQRRDGAFANAEDGDEIVGHMLLALAQSWRQRPADWKITVLRRACGYYLPWWRTHRNMPSLSAQVQAYAAAYRWTRAACFAEAVREMSDWLCRQQYTQVDARHPDWLGGFREWAQGQSLATMPTSRAAAYAEALAAACGVARRCGDAGRQRRYRLALERSLGFLLTLQYTPQASQAFADWYGPTVQGGFFVSHEDGSLRAEDTCHAVGALLGYLGEAVHASAGQQKVDGRAEMLRVYYLLSAAFFENDRRPAGSLAVVDVS